MYMYRMYITPATTIQTSSSYVSRCAATKTGRTPHLPRVPGARGCVSLTTVGLQNQG